MPFTTKLKADCVEMINGELDSIPVGQLKEFRLIAEELHNIINWSFWNTVKSCCFFSPSQKSALPQETREHLDFIRYCFNTPKDFVASPKDYAEYKQILTERIIAKIAEFQAMNAQEQQGYIKFQEGKHHAPQLQISA